LAIAWVCTVHGRFAKRNFRRAHGLAVHGHLHTTARGRGHNLDLRIIALISILSVFVMIYGQYAVLYVATSNGRVPLVHSMTAPTSSVPLSSKTTFSHYLGRVVSHNSFDFRLKSAVISKGVNVSGTWAVVMFCLKFVGIILAPLVTYNSLTKNWRYSDAHRRYYKRRRLIRDLCDSKDIVALLEDHNVTLAGTVLESTLAAGTGKEDSKWLADLHWSKQSDPGEIVVRRFFAEGPKYVEDEARKCALQVGKDTVTSLLEGREDWTG
jgi:hypothetical protein